MKCPLALGLLVVLFGLRTSAVWGLELEPFPHSAATTGTLMRGVLSPLFDSTNHNLAGERIESFALLNLGIYTLKLTTSYFETAVYDGRLSPHDKRKEVMSYLTSLNLVGDLLTAEGEFAYDPSRQQAKGQQEKADGPSLMRFALKGKSNPFEYGAEHRLSAKGFMDLDGSVAWRSEEVSEVWAERSLGSIDARLTFYELREKLDEDSNRPRVTRSSALAFSHRRPRWYTSFTSRYSIRDDKFQGGQTADVISYELRTDYRPIDVLSVSPALEFELERDRSSGLRTERPSVSVSYSYKGGHETLSIDGSTSYTPAFSSADFARTRDFESNARLNWNFGDSVVGKRSLHFEFWYKHHLDAVSRADSSQEFSAMVLLRFDLFVAPPPSRRSGFHGQSSL